MAMSPTAPRRISSSASPTIPPWTNRDSQTVGYAVFGQVIDGMDVVDEIAQVPVGDNGPMKGQAPVDPILIKKISIIGEHAQKAAAKKK